MHWDELALHLVIDRAEGDFGSGIDASDGEIDLLPDRGDTDNDFDRMRDILLRDHDVLLLFDPRLDGIDDPDSELAHDRTDRQPSPARWFLPFDDKAGD